MLSLVRNVIFTCVFLAFFSACSSIRLPNYPDSSQDFKSSTSSSKSSSATMRPYTINGKTYYPTTVNVGESAQGTASWYGPNFHGKKTSNGETYNMNAMTAAHKTLPMNTMVKVINLKNNKSTIVRINDRGPFVAGRIIDLSRAAASAIDMLGSGTAPVRLEVVGFSGAISAQNTQNTQTQGTYSGTGVSGGVINKNTIKEEIKTAIKTKTNETLSSALSTIGGIFMVQIGAFKNEAGAKAFSQKYSGTNGYKSVVKTFDIDGQKIYRVFLDGFRSEAEARDFVNSKNFGGAFIIRQ